jgi:hypothetical protein
MSRILVATYGGGHVNTVLPVALQLVELGHDVTVLALTTAWGAVDRAGLKTIGFRDFLDGDIRAIDHGQRLGQGTQPHPQVHPDESVAYLGMSYVELEDRLGVEGAAQAFVERGRQSFLPLGVLRRIFDAVDPELVIATSSPRAERASVLVARERNIPAVVIADLMPQMEMEWMGSPEYGDILCVINEGVRRKLIRAGRDPDCVVATGNPVMDEHLKLDVLGLRETWRTKHGCVDSDRVALYASQPDPDQYLGSRVAAELVCEGLDRGWKVAVRPHPNEDFDATLLPTGTILSGKDETPWQCLCGADACVVISSTMGIQSVLVGRPLVAYAVPVNMNPTPYPEFEIGRVAYTCAEVFDHLDDVFGKGELMAKELPKGSARDNVVAQVLRLLR